MDRPAAPRTALRGWRPADRALAAWLALVALGLCGFRWRNPGPGEGFVDVPGGRVWYHVVGSGSGTPLLAVHGGPGAPSTYLNPLSALGNDRPVIFYDQLDTGRSDRPNDKSLWTIDRFVKELAAVRAALGLEELYLYGHSWGTIVAAEYLYTRPSGVKGLVLASPCLSIPAWQRDADALLRTLPAATRAIIARHEREKTYDSPEYQHAVEVYYRRYFVRRHPWPAEVQATFEQLNPALYTYMNGPSEFSLTGTLRDYDSTKRLSEIHVPTLLTVGRYDEARVDTVRSFQRALPGSELSVIEDAGHLAMQDQPKRYVHVVRAFLRRLETMTSPERTPPQ